MPFAPASPGFRPRTVRCFRFVPWTGRERTSLPPSRSPTPRWRPRAAPGRTRGPVPRGRGRRRANRRWEMRDWQLVGGVGVRRVGRQTRARLRARCGRRHSFDGRAVTGGGGFMLATPVRVPWIFRVLGSGRARRFSHASTAARPRGTRGCLPRTSPSRRIRACSLVGRKPSCSAERDSRRSRSATSRRCSSRTPSRWPAASSRTASHRWKHGGGRRFRWFPPCCTSSGGPTTTTRRGSSFPGSSRG